MTAKDYFAQKAEDYNTNRSRGFLGLLRESERKAIFTFLQPQKGDSVLDAGCGEGYYALLAHHHGADVCGIDISAEMIKQVQKKGIPGKVCDVETCTLNKKFDKIICAGILEFTKNPGNVFKNLARHLKPKGYIVALYSRPSLGTYTYAFLHRLHGIHIKVISYRKLQTLLQGAGLTLTHHTTLPFFGGVARIEHMRGH